MNIFLHTIAPFKAFQNCSWESPFFVNSSSSWLSSRFLTIVSFLSFAFSNCATISVSQASSTRSLLSRAIRYVCFLSFIWHFQVNGHLQYPQNFFLYSDLSLTCYKFIFRKSKVWFPQYSNTGSFKKAVCNHKSHANMMNIKNCDNEQNNKMLKDELWLI